MPRVRILSPRCLKALSQRAISAIPRGGFFIGSEQLRRICAESRQLRRMSRHKKRAPWGSGFGQFLFGIETVRAELGFDQPVHPFAVDACGSKDGEGIAAVSELDFLPFFEFGLGGCGHRSF